MPWRGRVARPHEERVGVAHPALDRLGELVLEAGVDVAEGGEPGAAVEVLVGAADGEVGVPLVEGDGHRAGGVAQVPRTSAPASWADPGELRGVGEPGGAVRDVVEHDEGGALADGLAELVGGDALGGVDLDPAQRQPALGGDALGDVAVGREVVGVDDDLGAAGVRAHGVVDGGAHQLVEPDRGRVADRRLAGRRHRGRSGPGRRRAWWAGPSTARPSPRMRRPPQSCVDEVAEAVRPSRRRDGRASCRRSRRGRSRPRRTGRGSGRGGRRRRARLRPAGSECSPRQPIRRPDRPVGPAVRQ